MPHKDSTNPLVGIEHLFEVFTGEIKRIGKGLTVDVFKEFNDQLARVGLSLEDALSYLLRAQTDQREVSDESLTDAQKRVLNQILLEVDPSAVDELSREIQEILGPAFEEFGEPTGISPEGFTITFHAIAMAWFKQNPRATPETLLDDDNFTQTLETIIGMAVEVAELTNPELTIPQRDGSFRSATNADRHFYLERLQEQVATAGGMIEQVFGEITSPEWTENIFPAGTEAADGIPHVTEAEWAANIDLFVLNEEDPEVIAYLNENRAEIEKGFFEQDDVPQDVATYFNGWIAATFLTDNVRSLIRESQNNSINVTRPDQVLDPLITRLIGTGLGLELDLIAREAIKGFLQAEQSRNIGLTKEQLFAKFDEQNFRQAVDRELTVFFMDQPGGGEWVEAFLATGHTFSGLLFAVPGSLERLGITADGSLTDFMESVMVFGESRGIARPVEEIHPEAINSTVFFRELFATQFKGMDVFMRGAIINNLKDRATAEGFDILNSATASEISDFFQNQGLFSTVARATISNFLRAHGDEGQALLDKLDENGNFLASYKDLPIPDSTFTRAGYDNAIAPILKEYEVPEVEEGVEVNPIDEAIAEILGPLIENLPLQLQARAIVRANQFMEVQRTLNPSLTDEELRELIDEEGTFSDVLEGEIENEIRAQFSGDEILESVFEASGGALAFFNNAIAAGIDPENLDPERLSDFVRDDPTTIIEFIQEGTLGGDTSAFSEALAQEADEREFQERLDEANRLVAEERIAFDTSAEGIALREQGRQRERKIAARGIFEPALEREAGRVLGINRRRFVLQDFGADIFEEFFAGQEARASGENLFVRDQTVAPAGGTPAAQRGLEIQTALQQQGIPQRLTQLSNLSLIARQRFFATQGQRRRQRNLGGL